LNESGHGLILECLCKTIENFSQDSWIVGGKRLSLQLQGESLNESGHGLILECLCKTIENFSQNSWIVGGKGVSLQLEGNAFPSNCVEFSYSRICRA
jgi:phenylpyruvate tautomerase PptA (4-oxalocrotonate tautomerase family)